MQNLIDIFPNHYNDPVKATITCITDDQQEEQISYAELYDQARYILHNFRCAGIGEGAEVIFQFQSDMNFIKVLWACILGKIIPVPITFNTTIAGVDKICGIWSLLNDPFIITDYSDYKKVTEVFVDRSPRWKTASNKIFLLSEYLKPVQMAEVADISSDDIAFLQFSSGSTGNPKGVVNTHGAIINNLSDMAACFKLSGNDRFLGWMPLTHDLGMVFFHMLPFYLNVPQYLMQPMNFMANPAIWIERMAAHGITVSGSPNFGFKYVNENTQIRSLPPTALSSLRILLNGAEPISPAVCERFNNYLRPFGLAEGVIRPVYGLAEATLVVTATCENTAVKAYTIDRNKQNIGDQVEFTDPGHTDAVAFVDVGQSIGTEVRITDEQGVPLKEGRVGIIHVKGPAVTRSYYNLPVESAKIINAEGWLNTGDAGFLYKDNLVITGRMKEMIIVHGQNYYPHDLDRVLEELEWTRSRQVVSAGIYNEELACDEIFFFVVYNGDMEGFIPLVNSTRRLIRARLGLEIGRIVPVKRIPKTTSGKIRRYQLCQEYKQGLYDSELKKLADILVRVPGTGMLRQAETQLEKDIAGICMELLGLERVGLQDNFFDLGYSSLTITAFKVEVEARLGIAIEKAQFYRYPTVRSLTAFIHCLKHPVEDEPANDRKEIYDKARKKLLNHIRQVRIVKPG
ncbi:AMP-binding protein [Niastella sp. OAS944]|uniref:non-ribosomal peptide synthetase n=1 Tax=Niastella sp. OAS944 TaxID=2664089 RepID=UPI00346E5D99|nr:acyl-CoA synthetase (AMP-forming)/AMP-acid ligase II/acyl carrier protein [Chitinophagaceae bacterium OAS944]